MIPGMDNEGSFDQGEPEQRKPNSEKVRRKELTMCLGNRVAGKPSVTASADRFLPWASSLLNVLVAALAPVR